MSSQIDQDYLVSYSYLAVFRGNKGRLGGTNYMVTCFHQRKSERNIADRQIEKWAIGQAQLKNWDLQEIYRLPEQGLFAEQAALAIKMTRGKR